MRGVCTQTSSPVTLSLTNDPSTFPMDTPNLLLRIDSQIQDCREPPLEIIPGDLGNKAREVTSVIACKYEWLVEGCNIFVFGEQSSDK